MTVKAGSWIPTVTSSFFSVIILGQNTMAGSNPHVNVKTLLVAQLRDELDKRGLDTTGLKKDVSWSARDCPLDGPELMAARGSATEGARPGR